MNREVVCFRAGTLAAMLAAVAMLAVPAHAGLMAETVNGEPVTFDTVSGLTWLDVSKTLGLSANTALHDFPAFQLATEQQVITLLKNAGMPAADLPNGSTPDTAPGNLLATTLGYSLNPWLGIYGPGAQGWEYESWGWFRDTSGTTVDQFSVDVRNPPLGSDGTYASVAFLGDSPVVASSNNFDFLVMSGSLTTPEPTTLALMGMGLGSLAVWHMGRLTRRTATAENAAG